MKSMSWHTLFAVFVVMIIDVHGSFFKSNCSKGRSCSKNIAGQSVGLSRFGKGRFSTQKHPPSPSQFELSDVMPLNTPTDSKEHAVTFSRDFFL